MEQRMSIDMFLKDGRGRKPIATALMGLLLSNGKQRDYRNSDLYLTMDEWEGYVRDVFNKWNNGLKYEELLDEYMSIAVDCNNRRLYSMN